MHIQFINPSIYVISLVIFFTGTCIQQLKDRCKESTNGDPEGMFEAADINDLAGMQTNIGNVKMCWCMQHNMVVLYEDVLSVPKI